MSGFLGRTVRSVTNPVRPGRIISRGLNPLREIHNAAIIEYRGYYTFDINVIRVNWQKINRSPLTKAGNLVRAIARRSIRDKSARGRYKPSTPPNPPYSLQRKSKKQLAGGGESRPFKMIYSLPNIWETSVMVGMVGFKATDPVPGVHELGLPAVRYVATKGFKKGRLVTLRTPKGIRKMYLQKRPTKYPKRPFMRPALVAAVPSLPMLWKDSFSGAASTFVAGVH